MDRRCNRWLPDIHAGSGGKRLAVYEFLHEPETPAKVIINEALELARSFSTDDSVRFINGVLDAVRRSLSRE